MEPPELGNSGGSLRSTPATHVETPSNPELLKPCLQPFSARSWRALTTFSDVCDVASNSELAFLLLPSQQLAYVTSAETIGLSAKDTLGVSECYNGDDCYLGPNL